ncbi:MAG: DUF3990 domain-containing protein [Clostridia bacterium]|nr:DUF3990 domain-containing protein [Clostridia bacterium]
MKTLLRQIRSHLNLSQTAFAEQLHVTFQTVNRWENGKVVPNKLAQSEIYDFCKENKVPVYDFIINKIAAVSAGIKLDAGRMLLYHGSKSGIEGSISPRSRKQCDFGKGFYMGSEPAQALTLICDYEKSKFYIISICADELAHLEVPADLEWAMIVAFNRGRMEKINGTCFYNKYRAMTADKDLIIGSIANDRMFYVIDNFFIGNITDAALVNSLSALQLGKQYVAVTQKGCDNVRIECEVPLSYLEKLVIRDVAEENRTRGVSLANDICKNYRREGKFFDEILDEAMREEELHE